MSGRERRDADLGAHDRDRGPDAPEERVARLVGDEKRERREHGGLVQDDLGRIEEGDAGDEREKAVPEREGVAGMQPAVRELVDRVERERVERLQLAHAREVEEAVAADLAGDVPEQHAQHRSGAEAPTTARESAPAAARAARTAARRPRLRATGRAPDVSDAPAANVTASAPKRSASDQASVTEAPRSPRARATIAPGHSKIAGREREAHQGHRSSSSGTRPDASHVGGVAVHPPTLVAEQPRAQPQRPAEQPPRPLGVANAAVLGEEPQVAADVLAEHPAAVRGAADVHALGAGEEAAPSSRPARSGSTSPSPR